MSSLIRTFTDENPVTGATSTKTNSIPKTTTTSTTTVVQVVTVLVRISIFPLLIFSAVSRNNTSLENRHLRSTLNNSKTSTDNEQQPQIAIETDIETDILASTAFPSSSSTTTSSAAATSSAPPLSLPPPCNGPGTPFNINGQSWIQIFSGSGVSENPNNSVRMLVWDALNHVN
ncbi:hypothetical protein BDZ45DRAFT_724658 [Acephala macrosclerotiorum]|nr:hypothetical protein BDZ45DRAFT_724658 [Acephala macrosclerotiorum]